MAQSNGDLEKEGTQQVRFHGKVRSTWEGSFKLMFKKKIASNKTILKRFFETENLRMHFLVFLAMNKYYNFSY